MPQYEELASKCLPAQDAIPDLMTAISSAVCQGASDTWRIVITAVNGCAAGGSHHCDGSQVQLTEAAFMLGSDQLGAGMVAPVISSVTNGQDPLFMNNGDPASGDQLNCDPLPCSFAYVSTQAICTSWDS